MKAKKKIVVIAGITWKINRTASERHSRISELMHRSCFDIFRYIYSLCPGIFERGAKRDSWVWGCWSNGCVTKRKIVPLFRKRLCYNLVSSYSYSNCIQAILIWYLGETFTSTTCVLFLESVWLRAHTNDNCVLGLGEIGPEDPNFKIKTCTLRFH